MSEIEGVDWWERNGQDVRLPDEMWKVQWRVNFRWATNNFLWTYVVDILTVQIVGCVWNSNIASWVSCIFICYIWRSYQDGPCDPMVVLLNKDKTIRWKLSVYQARCWMSEWRPSEQDTVSATNSQATEGGVKGGHVWRLWEPVMAQGEKRIKLTFNGASIRIWTHSPMVHVPSQ